jgi:hypothetical protein
VNCVPDTNPTCSIAMNNNEPVGAIFNAPSSDAVVTH